MQIIEVNTRKLKKAFLSLPAKIYKDDPCWISPLYSDIEAVFDPARNHFFTHGECIRWILADNGRILGRIAAFIDYEKVYKTTLPAGGIGFFEATNKEAAFLLFDTARQWLKEKGMKAMDGPVNFGENDKYWGLLVEGFKPPSYGMNYNPPVYQDYFESYGFTRLYDQYTNFLDATVPMPERFTRIAEWVIRKPGYSFRPFSKKMFEKQAADFIEIYNDAWSGYDHFSPLKSETVRDVFRQIKPVLDERIIWFAYYHHEPVAFIVCLPDVNQIFRHLNGKMNVWGKLKFLWYRASRPITRLRITAMGCKRKYQNRGMESALIHCLQQEVLPRHTIKEVELAWVADWNKKMIALHEATGAKREKVHRTYRYHFPAG